MNRISVRGIGAGSAVSVLWLVGGEKWAHIPLYLESPQLRVPLCRDFLNQIQKFFLDSTLLHASRAIAWVDVLAGLGAQTRWPGNTSAKHDQTKQHFHAKACAEEAIAMSDR